jgi:hypothetical protein
MMAARLRDGTLARVFNVVAPRSGPMGRFVLRPRVAIPSIRSKAWPIALLRRIWTLPTDVCGHLACLAVCRRAGRRVGGVAAEGYLYVMVPDCWLSWIGAITLGHAILCRSDLLEGELGRVLLAHELAHTRQHDVLGPFYLPLHASAQALSALLSLVLPGRVPSVVHAYNPLEQTFICLGATAVRSLADGELLSKQDREALLARFEV